MQRVFSGDASIRWLPRASAALLWALVAATAVLWVLHVPQNESTPVASVAPGLHSAQDSSAVLRALGHTSAQAAEPEASRRFVLQGVIATDAGHGSALIAVDGQPARTFLQGQAVVEGWQLQSVSPQEVRLAGSAQSSLALRLPARP